MSDDCSWLEGVSSLGVVSFDVVVLSSDCLSVSIGVSSDGVFVCDCP